MRCFLTTLTLCVIGCGPGQTATPASPEVASRAPCAPATAPDPSETIRRMYAATMKGDKPAILAELEPDFYAFDGGKRFSRTEFAGIVDLIRSRGQMYRWTVNDPDVHVACDTAWVAYINRGSVTDASGTTPRIWVESAELDWRGGGWKLRFFHSTPVPAAAH